MTTSTENETQTAWRYCNAQVHLHEIADGLYVRYEQKHFRILRGKLPIGVWSDEDLIAEIRSFACEAAHKFDPDLGYTFPAFLNRHLQQRCMQTWGRAWSPTHYPDGGRWVRNDTAWGVGTDPESHLTLTESAPSRLAPEEEPIEMTEIIHKLSPEAQCAFRVLAADHTLIELAHELDRRRKLARASGLAIETIDLLFSEVIKRWDRLYVD